MLFKKARKILASGDKPDVLAAKILRNPIFDVNEFAFQGNALSEGQTLLMVRPPHLWIRALTCDSLRNWSYGMAISLPHKWHRT
jgi:hypothetical protein